MFSIQWQIQAFFALPQYSQYRLIEVALSIRNYIIIALIIGIIAQIPLLQPLLVWDRQAILNGEIWRILTGNITHTNWIHLAMNASAFVIISFIFRAHFTAHRYNLLILALSSIIGLGLFATQISWYAGFSGVLHGLFAWGAVRDIQTKTKGGWLLLLGLIIKITSEQCFGGSASSAELIGVQVATQAHLIGAISGVIMAFFIPKNSLIPIQK
ncbi:rhombosortase [Photobacterium aquimaris]|uniref:Rhombosortase n=1 Tax=Photobacterium aquimaris TaxID=512643 RepID=A0A2T3HXG8_9GAMM|nr:rhombosortase [Photobacterium aquimaris]